VRDDGSEARGTRDDGGCSEGLTVRNNSNVTDLQLRYGARFGRGLDDGRLTTSAGSTIALHAKQTSLGLSRSHKGAAGDDQQHVDEREGLEDHHLVYQPVRREDKRWKYALAVVRCSLADVLSSPCSVSFSSNDFSLVGRLVGTHHTTATLHVHVDSSLETSTWDFHAKPRMTTCDI
jgi:hypothetical protein